MESTYCIIIPCSKATCGKLTYTSPLYYFFQVFCPLQTLIYPIKLEDLAFLNLEATQHFYTHNFHCSEDLVVGNRLQYPVQGKYYNTQYKSISSSLEVYMIPIHLGHTLDMLSNASFLNMKQPHIPKKFT
jgi:hypothetical protein